MSSMSQLGLAAASLAVAAMGAGSVVAVAALAAVPTSPAQAADRPGTRHAGSDRRAGPTPTRMVLTGAATPSGDGAPTSTPTGEVRVATAPPAPAATSSHPSSTLPTAAEPAAVRPMTASTAAAPVRLILTRGRFDVVTVVEQGHQPRVVEAAPTGPPTPSAASAPGG